METPESENRHSLLNDSTTNTTSYKPRKRPRSVVVIQSDESTRDRSCSKLEKFLILMLSLMLVCCLVLLCLYLNEKNLNEQLKQNNTQTKNSQGNYTGSLKEHFNQSKYSFESCWTKNCVQTSTELLSSLDPSADPCSDFYQYACGKWEDKNPPRPEAYQWDQFAKLNMKTEELMKRLIVDKNTRARYSRNEAVVKAFKYYDSCMDEAEIERLKGRPLKQILKKYGSWSVIDKTWNESAWEFQSFFVVAHKELHSSPFIDVYVNLDMDNISTNIISIDYSFLSLSVNGFLANGTMYDQLRAALKEVMFNLSQALGGDDSSIKDMEQVFDFERQISKILPTSDDRRAKYKKLTIKQLQQETGNALNWLQFLRGMVPDSLYKLDEDKEIVVYCLEYLKKLFKIVARTPKRLLSNFMMWRVVKKQYHQLSHDYIDIYRNFLTRAFKFSNSKSRQNVCLGQLNKHFSLPVSRIYADQRFNPGSKKLAKEIIENLRTAFIENVRKVDWMDNITKEAAINKAKALVEEVGYPEDVMDEKALDDLYKEVVVDSKTYFMNEMSLRRNANLKSLYKIGEPVSFDDWPFPATTSNAFYSYNFNQMVFPAGMLQPPFFDSRYSRAVNYGGIGTIMAHEVTHGFDDAGKNFNEDGAFVKWWTDLSLANFNNKSQCLVEQYSNYTVYGKQQINGKNTLSENIADNGGVKQAFLAYKNWVRDHGEEPRLPGMMLTNEQVFFIAFARNWCGKQDPFRSLLMLQHVTYPPTPWRVNGTLRNSVEFAKTFNCPLGSPMNPVKKCHVW